MSADSNEITASAEAKKPILSNRLYDHMKNVATIYLPASSAFYVAMAAIWHWGFTVEVAGTAAAVATFLGVVLKISSTQYLNQPFKFDGTLVTNDPNPDADAFRFEVNKPFDELAGQKMVILKVDDYTGK